jgi:phage gp29-like protein
MVDESKKNSFLTRFSAAFRLKESKDVTPIETQAVVPLTEPFGSYGTASYGGYASEEYLSTLRGRARADIFDQMRRSDTQVRLCLSAVKNPIKSATFEVEPGEDTDEAKADAELIEHILFNDMDSPWDEFLSEALSMVEFGHSVFEVINKVTFNNKKFGTYNGIKKLAFRSQRTIERWNLDQATGDLLSVTQYAFGDLQKLVDIPAENLLVYSVDKEGANYEGVSMLRPCYGPWFRKNNYLKFNAIGIEKFAVPTPLVEVPPGQEKGKQNDLMIASLESYLVHQKNFLLFPSGWKLTLNANSYDPTKVEMSVDNEDKRMAKAFLANFLELGMHGSGSFALSNDLSDFFLTSLEFVARKIIEQINLKLIPKLIKMNRGQRDAYPIIKVSGISDKAGKELAEVLNLLTGSKVIIPDEPLETHVRKRFGLPKASTDGQRLPAAPNTNLPAPGATLAERIRAAELRRKRLS